MDCIFCKIATGSEPSYKINENEKYLAFLDVVPLVEGQTVVITKKHFGSYHFDLPDDAYAGLMVFAKRTAKKLDATLGSERTLMAAQGYAIDHAHVKLFPVKKVHARTPDAETYKQLVDLIKGKWYSGYIISMSGREKASPEALQALQRKITGLEPHTKLLLKSFLLPLKTRSAS